MFIVVTYQNCAQQNCKIDMRWLTARFLTVA